MNNKYPANARFYRVADKHKNHCNSAVIFMLYNVLFCIWKKELKLSAILLIFRA